VRAADYHGHACEANRISYAVRFLRHSCHCADADETDFFFFYELDDLVIAHRTRIGIN
jgi:hypothetical protein